MKTIRQRFGTIPDPHELQELGRQVAAWRQAQTRPAPLPEAVWVQAAALARILGVSRVARTLGLGYYQLRDRLAPTVPAGFVELSPPTQPTPAAAAMVVELRDGGGGQLTVRLAHDPATLRALAADFWRRAR